MKTKLLALFLLPLACACAQMETIDLGQHGRLTLYFLGDWKIDNRTMANRGTIAIAPKDSSVNASCTIGITLAEGERLDSKSRLKLRVEAEAAVYEEASVEGKARAREFMLSVPGAYGFYCNFTDASLRGRPSEPGNFKVVSVGKIKLSPQVILEVFIGADDFREQPYQQLLGAIEGMEYTPGNG